MGTGEIRDFTDLLVWQKAMDLVVATYRATDGMPKSEAFGLTAQMRRAVVSIPSNIAEGHGRRRTREYLHHLDIANGSLAEVRTQAILTQRLGYLASNELADLHNLADETGRLLNGLIRSLGKRLPDADWRVAEDAQPYGFET